MLEISSVELQQIWQLPRHSTIVGGRFQTGDFTTKNLQFDPTGTINAPFITPTSETPAQDANFSPGFERISLYGYHDWQIADSVLLVGGVSYDRITFPENFRIAPISDKKKTEERVSPKAGLIWTPANNTILRAVYTRSLSGAR